MNNLDIHMNDYIMNLNKVIAKGCAELIGTGKRNDLKFNTPLGEVEVFPRREDINGREITLNGERFFVFQHYDDTYSILLKMLEECLINGAYVYQVLNKFPETKSEVELDVNLDQLTSVLALVKALVPGTIPKYVTDLADSLEKQIDVRIKYVLSSRLSPQETVGKIKYLMSKKIEIQHK